MSDLRTEEEQVEALKRWWKENGKQLVTGLLLALAVWLSWNAYQNNKQVTGEQAQVQYQELLSLREKAENSEEAAAEAQVVATEIKKNFEGTPYAIYAALFIAKDAVEDKKLDQAEEELKWALKASDKGSIKQLVETRLARVLIAKGSLDEALKLVDKAPEGPFQALYLEIKGDALKLKGDNALAKQAYDQALSAKDQSASTYLEMKAADLAGTAMAEPATQAGAVSEAGAATQN